MKIPLRYQTTEYDCGTTSIINAITYLFEREEIPPIIIYNISKYTLDEFNEKGEENKGGTSTSSVRLLAHWINSFAKTRNFNIVCEILVGKEVDLFGEKVINCMNSDGVILARVWHGMVEHYIIITKIADESAYIFDPYYIDITTYDNDNEVEIIKYKKLQHNRIVSLNRMMSKTVCDYSLVNNENKELLLINKTNNQS